MSTAHAYFSATWATIHGSSVYRRADGTKVSVTRTNTEKDGRRKYPWDERYVGEVIRTEDGGCIEPATVPDGARQD